MRIRLCFFILLLGLAACEASALPADYTDLPPGVADSARAIALRQTAEAARVAAEQSARRATDAINAQRAVEGRLTAVAQATRDTLSVRATTDAQNATATTYAADYNATLSARASQRNGTAVAAVAQATSTARVQRQEETATAIAFNQTDTAHRALVSATAEAVQGTRTSATATAVTLAQSAQATATRVAQLAEVEAEQAAWDRNYAPWRALGFALLPFVIVLVILGLFGLAAFLGMRWYMQWEQNARVIKRDDGVIVIESGNAFGGKPVYKWLDPPKPQQLPASFHVAEDFTDGDESKGGDDMVDGDNVQLQSLPLNLDELPHALALPLGMSHTGARYLSLHRLNHALIAGPTESGKTTLLHAFAAALLHHAVPSKQAVLWLYDGKQGMKFERYKRLGARYISDEGMPRALAELIGEMNKRYEMFRACGADSFAAYNLRDTDLLPHLVFIIDELRAALERPGALEQILKLMKEGREAGIHLIMATQFVEAKYIPNDVRGNASTRIAFAVPTVHNSLAILGSSGAELLPKVPGRYLLEAGNERVEIQAFTVTPPAAPRGVDEPPSQFTPDEKKMILIAAREGGWFKTKLIAGELGTDDSKVTEVAQAWEGRGWLSEEKFNVGRKGKNGRALLLPLIGLAQKEGLLPLTFMSPLVKTEGDMVGSSGDMVKPRARVAKKAAVSA